VLLGIKPAGKYWRSSTNDTYEDENRLPLKFSTYLIDNIFEWKKGDIPSMRNITLSGRSIFYMVHIISI